MKKVLVRLSEQKVNIMDAVAEMKNIDRDCLISLALGDWICEHVDDYEEEIKKIFNRMDD